MKTGQRRVEVVREIDATPESVFLALTHPLELSYWFCHQAWTAPRAGGDFQARWRNGWWVRGVYQMVERPRRIDLTWLGKDEPGETSLTFKIDALDQGVLVRVIHSGYTDHPVWDKAVAEAESSWSLAVDNLESVLTTGIDKRQANRPILGIVPEELKADQSAKANLEIDTGVYIAGLIQDGGAAASGLQKGDVIVSIGGLSVSDPDSLATTLANFRADERVHVYYLRGLARRSAAVVLQPASMPEVSFDPHDVAARIGSRQAALLTQVRQAVARLSDEQTRRRPTADEWSIVEVLAHLSLCERFTQGWLADTIVGTTPGQTGGNRTALPEMLAMTLAAAPTVETLLSRWENDMEETRALFAALRPAIVDNKARYHAMASNLLLDFHVRDHVNQIEVAVDALQS